MTSCWIGVHQAHNAWNTVNRFFNKVIKCSSIEDRFSFSPHKAVLLFAKAFISITSLFAYWHSQTLLKNPIESLFCRAIATSSCSWNVSHNHSLNYLHDPLGFLKSHKSSFAFTWACLYHKIRPFICLQKP